MRFINFSKYYFLILSTLQCSYIILCFNTFVSVEIIDRTYPVSGLQLALGSTKIYPEVWVMLSIIAGFLGFLSLLIRRTKFDICFLFSLAATAGLLMAKFSIEAKVGMNYNAVSFKPAYWFSLALVAAAGSASYIFQHHLIYKKLAAEKKNERININIITNNKSAVAKNK